jgi:hypothetical protein
MPGFSLFARGGEGTPTGPIAVAAAVADVIGVAWGRFRH